MKRLGTSATMFSIDEAQDYVARTDRFLRSQSYFDGHITLAAEICARRTGKDVACKILDPAMTKGLTLPEGCLAPFITSALVDHDRWMRARARNKDQPAPIYAYSVAFAVTALRHAQSRAYALQDVESWRSLAQEPAFRTLALPQGSYAAIAMGTVTENSTLLAAGYALLAHSDRDLIATPFGGGDRKDTFPMGFSVAMQPGLTLYLASADAVLTALVIEGDTVTTVGECCDAMACQRTDDGQLAPLWPMVGCWDVIIKALSSKG